MGDFFFEGGGGVKFQIFFGGRVLEIPDIFWG